MNVMQVLILNWPTQCWPIFEQKERLCELNYNLTFKKVNKRNHQMKSKRPKNWKQKKNKSHLKQLFRNLYTLLFTWAWPAQVAIKVKVKEKSLHQIC